MKLPFNIKNPSSKEASNTKSNAKASVEHISETATTNSGQTAEMAKSNLLSLLKSHKKAVAALAVVLLLMMFGTNSGSSQESQTANLPDNPTPLAQEPEPKEGALSFMLKSSDWNTKIDESIAVRVEGTTDAGDVFLEDYKAVPGQKYDLSVEPGVYTIGLATGKPTKGENLYKCTPKEEKFGGTADKTVILPIELDTAKMAEIKKAAEEKKATEEAKRKEEEKQKAEAAAAEAARIQAEQQQSQTQAQSDATAVSSTRESSVYIASSGNGSKYHSNPSCSRMKGTISMTRSEAEAQGYTACAKCYR